MSDDPTALIEHLTQERDEAISGSALTIIADDIEKLAQERDEARAENKRLREALAGMVSCHGLPSSPTCGNLERAHRALEAGE